MGDVLGRVVALGIVGFDPTVAVLLVSAIAARAGRTKVFAFTAMVFVTSILAGVALALVGKRVFGESRSITSGPVLAYFEVETALASLVWLASNLMSSDSEPGRPVATSHNPLQRWP